MAGDVIEGQSFAGCGESGHVWRKRAKQDFEDEEPQVCVCVRVCDVCVCVCHLISMWSCLVKWRAGCHKLSSITD